MHARKKSDPLEGTRWTLPEASGRSGVDGRFEIRLAPFPCNAANGDVTAAGFVGASLSFPRIAAGESQDLGDIVLQRGARIHGRVLDRAGKPSPAVWSITARMEPNNQAPPRSDARIQLRERRQDRIRSHDGRPLARLRAGRRGASPRRPMATARRRGRTGAISTMTAPSLPHRPAAIWSSTSSTTPRPPRPPTESTWSLVGIEARRSFLTMARCGSSRPAATSGLPIP